jgi:hypothetical protein
MDGMERNEEKESPPRRTREGPCSVGCLRERMGDLGGSLPFREGEKSAGPGRLLYPHPLQRPPAPAMAMDWTQISSHLSQLFQSVGKAGTAISDPSWSSMNMPAYQLIILHAIAMHHLHCSCS